MRKASLTRDPPLNNMNKQWFFGMKLHIGVHSKTGLARSAVVTSPNVHDKHPLPVLMHGAETHLYGDCAYSSQQALIHPKAPNAKDCTNQRVIAGRAIKGLKKIVNRLKFKARPGVEHVFAVVKRLWRFNKVRYRGLSRNATGAFVVTGLANIYLGAEAPRGMSAPAWRTARAGKVLRASIRFRSARFTGLSSRMKCQCRKCYRNRGLFGIALDPSSV